MARRRFIREQFIDRPIDDVFAFYADAANLQRITPPWLHFQIITPPPIRMQEGTRIDYRIRLRRIPIVWKTRITRWEPPVRFVDVQLSGPYRTWEHTHEFHAVSGGTIVRDTVDYELPGGWLGELVRRVFVARDIARIFEYRRTALADALDGDDAPVAPAQSHNAV